MKAFRTLLIPIEFALDVAHPRLRCTFLGNLLIVFYFNELFRMQSEHQLAKQRGLRHGSLKSWRHRNWRRNTTSSPNQVLEPKRQSQTASEEKQCKIMNRNSQSKTKQGSNHHQKITVGHKQITPLPLQRQSHSTTNKKSFSPTA